MASTCKAAAPARLLKAAPVQGPAEELALPAPSARLRDPRPGSAGPEGRRAEPPAPDKGPGGAPGKPRRHGGARHGAAALGGGRRVGGPGSPRSRRQEAESGDKTRPRQLWVRARPRVGTALPAARPPRAAGSGRVPRRSGAPPGLASCPRVPLQRTSLEAEPCGGAGLLPAAGFPEQPGTAYGLRVALLHARTNIHPRDSLDIKKALITVI